MTCYRSRRQPNPLFLSCMLPLCLSSIEACADGPTLYGRINLSVNRYHFEAIETSRTTSKRNSSELESNGSRLGVKGELPIQENLTALYQIEYGVALDGDGDTFTQRNTYGGLQGPWGRLIAGRHDTPLKLIHSKMDLFSNLPLADVKNLLVGENRKPRTILYTSPSFASGLTASVAAVTGEDSRADGSQRERSLSDGSSISLRYEQGPLYLAIAQDHNVSRQDVLRATAVITAGALQLGGLYQRAEEHSSGDGLANISSSAGAFSGRGRTHFKKQDAWLINATYQLDEHWKLKAQYGQADSTPLLPGLDEVQARQMVLSIDYTVNSNFRLYAYSAAMDTKGDRSIHQGTIRDYTVAVGGELRF